MFEGFMRKLGYISEKNLIDIAVETWNKEDTSKAVNVKDFYYRSGNANAISYILGRLGIDITKIIKERRNNV